MYNDMSPTELCWQTGDYTDECYCEFCEHSDECSGSEDKDWWDRRVVRNYDSSQNKRHLNRCLFIIKYY